MLFGLYHSSHGANAMAHRLDVIANNMANTDTAGFKRDLAIFQQSALSENMLAPNPDNLQNHAGVVGIAETVTDYSNGGLEQTNGTLDIALMGPGFLRLAPDADGNELLTRSGKLSINGVGRLVELTTGREVMQPTDTPIGVPPNLSDIEINEVGMVMGVDDRGIRIPLGQLHLVQPDDFHNVEKIGENLYGVNGDLETAGPDLTVHQGFIERSTVQPMMEMLAMIETSRQFEANMNMIQYQEQSLGQLLQTMTR
jgi:flagellar basal-body rod protein FlgF